LTFFFPSTTARSGRSLGIAGGIFTRAKRTSPVSGFFVSMARFSERFDRNGKRVPGIDGEGREDRQTFFRK
jgi:hypothetical protein